MAAQLALSDDLVSWLLDDQQPDGGGNCERTNGSVRSSFDSTIVATVYA